MLTGVETGLRKRRKVQPQKAHQRRVIRVSETFDRKSKQRGRWPVPATAGCCAAKVHWTVCLSLATLTGAVAKRLGLGSLSPQTEKAQPQRLSFFSFVEMGGLEPPSKHRTRELSTRLVYLWFSTYGCRETGYHTLIL